MPGAVDGCGKTGALEQMTAEREGHGFEGRMDLDITCSPLILSRWGAHGAGKFLA